MWWHHPSDTHAMYTETVKNFSNHVVKLPKLKSHVLTISQINNKDSLIHRMKVILGTK